MKNTLKIAGIVSFLVGVVILGRVMPHLPNFAPVVAAGLFAGYVFRSRILAMLVPAAGLLISDLFFIGTYDWKLAAGVYIGLVLPAMLGTWLAKSSVNTDAPRWKQNLMKLGKGFSVAVASSTFFFLTSNLAVWAFSGMYAKNIAGFVGCFTAAVPFYKFTLAGDLFYSAAFFGVFGLATWLSRSRSADFAVRLA